MYQPTPAEVEAFWSHVQRGPISECWPCTGAERSGISMSRRNRTPHVRYCCPSGSYVAHHLSYELVIGPLPPNVRMWRTCAMENCVNPHHWSTRPRSEMMASSNGKHKGTWTLADGSRQRPLVEFKHRHITCVKCGHETILNPAYDAHERNKPAEPHVTAGWIMCSDSTGICEYCQREAARPKARAIRWRG